MSDVSSEREVARPETAGLSTITISLASRSAEDLLSPAEQIKEKRDQFWLSFQRYIERRAIQSLVPTHDPSEAEYQLRFRFPDTLRHRFESFLRTAYSVANKEAEPEDKRFRVLRSLKFYVGDIRYGSIEIQTIIEHLDQVIEVFGITAEIATAILSASAPGALNDALGIEGIGWNATVLDANIQTPTRPAAVPAGQGATGLLGRLFNPAFAWKLLNALWILPIVVSLLVLIAAYREMDRINGARDRAMSRVFTDEVNRVAARSDRFDEQHAALLQRHENVLKDTTEVIRTILADEVKRVAARSDYFDQQQSLLLRRYESLSKESTEVIKALLQKPDACCKSCDCDCKKPKDRCQKSGDSKSGDTK
jgi:hypothetical protein